VHVTEVEMGHDFTVMCFLKFVICKLRKMAVRFVFIAHILFTQQ